jgi:hypothetical protein
MWLGLLACATEYHELTVASPDQVDTGDPLESCWVEGGFTLCRAQVTWSDALGRCSDWGGSLADPTVDGTRTDPEEAAVLKAAVYKLGDLVWAGWGPDGCPALTPDTQSVLTAVRWDCLDQLPFACEIPLDWDG